MAKILIVEDDKVLAKIIKKMLESQMHVVELATDGTTGLNFIEESSFDLLILDWGLPEVSGVVLCDQYRQRQGQAPVLFLTARASIEDKFKGFSAGADDYLTKPFDVRELLMRVNALLKRTNQQLDETVLQVGELKMNPRAGIVTQAGESITLAPREFALLEFFMKHPNELFAPSTLIERLWEADAEATEVALRSCIARIRKKIDIPGRASIIQSVHGRGYRLVKE